MLIPFQKILHDYKITPTGVFHVGGHWAEEAEDYFNAGVDNAIFIEAMPDAYKKMCRILAPYPRMAAINECVGEVDGEKLLFNISNNEGQSSSLLQLGYHKTAHPEVHYTSQIEVTTKRIDTILKERNINIERYDFLNIDLQGSELSALKSMGSELAKIKYAYIEVNQKELYTGCPLIGDIDSFLANFGFERVALEWCGNFGWGDAFYIKK